MNTFNNIVITNITYNRVVTTLSFTPENEKKADAYARHHNMTNALQGTLSVHYTK